MLNADELRTRIVLRKPVQTPDATSGEFILTYADVATVWAAVEWESGRRFESAKQLNAEVQGVIRIHYRGDVKADWQFGLGNRNIQILSRSDYRERHEELWLNCREALD